MKESNIKLIEDEIFLLDTYKNLKSILFNSSIKEEIPDCKGSIMEWSNELLNIENSLKTIEEVVLEKDN